MSSTSASLADPQILVGALEHDVEHRFAGLRRLLEATDRINPSVLLDEAFRQLDEATRKSLGCERMEVLLLDEGGANLLLRWTGHPAIDEAQDKPVPSEPRQGSLLDAVLREGGPRAITDLRSLLAAPLSSAHLRDAAVRGLQSCLAVPLIGESGPMGLLLFYSSQAQAPGEGRLAWLSQLGPALSALITKGRLLEMVIQAQVDSERLLRNVLPGPIVKRLKAGEQVIADGIPEATVVFVDIVNFVNLSARMSPAAVIIVLNRIFSAFDALCEQYGVEKIKTIGDAYMLATGVPKPFAEHVLVAAKIALDMQELGKRLGTREERSMQFRIGIHTGPVIAGVIGTRKFTYDLWGDTVNIASRMESQGAPGRIHVSRPVYEKLKNDFEFEPRGRMPIKGVGEMESFFLLGPKAGNAYRSEVWSMLGSGGADGDSTQRRSEDR